MSIKGFADNATTKSDMKHLRNIGSQMGWVFAEEISRFSVAPPTRMDLAGQVLVSIENELLRPALRAKTVEEYLLAFDDYLPRLILKTIAISQLLHYELPNTVSQGEPEPALLDKTPWAEPFRASRRAVVEAIGVSARLEANGSRPEDWCEENALRYAASIYTWCWASITVLFMEREGLSVTDEIAALLLEMLSESGPAAYEALLEIEEDLLDAEDILSRPGPEEYREWEDVKKDLGW